MLSQRPRSNNPDIIKQTAAVLMGGVVLFICFGIFESLQAYKAIINRTVFACFCIITVLIMSCITAAAVFFHARLWQLFVEKSLANEQHRAALYAAQNTAAIFDATAQRISSGQVYLSNYKTADANLCVKAIPREIKQTNSALSEELQLIEPELKTTLLNDLEPLQRLLIVGGQNAGKTTLLKHIAKQRSLAGTVLILDSHDHAGKWNDDYKIVGHGRDYKSIETELNNLVKIMDARYKEYASGKIKEREHELITVISDEFSTIAENVNNLDSVLLPLLTESRKVGIDLILACHSETAGSLGLKGRFDLKKNFDAVLRLKNIAGSRIITLDNWECKSDYQHCGIFNDVQNKPKSSNYLNTEFTNKLTEIMSSPLPDIDVEKKIISAYWQLKKAGKPISLSVICVAVHGYKKGDKIKQITAILDANSLVTD